MELNAIDYWVVFARSRRQTAAGRDVNRTYGELDAGEDLDLAAECVQIVNWRCLIHWQLHDTHKRGEES